MFSIGQPWLNTWTIRQVSCGTFSVYSVPSLYSIALTDLLLAPGLANNERGSSVLLGVWGHATISVIFTKSTHIS